MRIAAIFIAVLLVSWIVFELLLQPVPELPTFAQAERDLGELQQAQRDGRLQEDPDRRELRQSVRRANERLKGLPCDEVLRQDFVDAVIPFLRAVMATRGEAPVETVRVGDRVLNGTHFLDGQVTYEIERAVDDGFLRADDLPPELAWIATQLPEIADAGAALRQIAGHPNCR